MLCRVAESECRLQPRTEVAKHGLQCRKFIATQFLAQDLKQYAVRSAWQSCRWSRGKGSVADGAAAAGGARTDLIQQRPLLNRLPFILGLIEDRAFHFTCKFICTQNHADKLIQMMAQKEIAQWRRRLRKELHHAHCEKKNGHGTSRPLRKEKWPL